MSDDWEEAFPPDPRTEADYATLRTLGRTRTSKSFRLTYGSTRDRNAWTKTVWQVISEDAGRRPTADGEEEEVSLHQSPGGRVQVKARIVRDRGRVAEIRFERVTGKAGENAKLESLLNLDEEAASRLIDLCLALKGFDPSDSSGQRFDEDLLAAMLADSQAFSAVYNKDPERFKALIESDVTASDVVAIAARRHALARFEELLTDPHQFESERAGGGHEAVWQRFFEANPWVLGVGLSGHLFTSWDPSKLEKNVGGATVTDVGKRVDALLTTSGVVRSVVLAELKRHDDPLLESDPIRSGCWAPSEQLTRGIAQAHTTADRARDDLGSWLSARDDDGYRTGEHIFSGSPRSYLVIGQLRDLTRAGQVHPDQVRSFELYRRNMSYPEVLTYDEVLARAKWSLDLIERRQAESADTDS